MQLHGLTVGLPDKRKNFRKLALSLLVMLTCLVVVARQSDQIDADRVSALIGDIALWQWATAMGLTALSFLAVGQYDALFHRWLDTGVSPIQAVTSGASAIALAQTLGFGLATGSVARWRLLPNLSLRQAIKITNYVSISFMVALGVVVGLLVVLSCSEVSAMTIGLSLGSVCVLLGVSILSLWQPHWLFFEIPPIGAMVRLLVLTLMDVCFAALALWVLLPDPLAMPVMVLLSAYAISLGAGLLAGTPGGIGPFELCLVALLPLLPEAHIIAAVVAFRLIYFAIPACVAACVIAFPNTRPQHRQVTKTTKPAHIQRAEAQGLARLPGHQLFQLGLGHHLTAQASQFSVHIGDAVDGRPLEITDLAQARSFARETGKSPAFYKIGAKSAANARQAGWRVLQISDEAVLEPNLFNVDGPDKRQLRRKLRKAEKAGVTIAEWDGQNEPELIEIAAAWANRMGGELGFSMGRFDLAYIRTQTCLVAKQRGAIIGFATFHSCQAEWVLDLMRQAANVPDGTMHALVHAAIGMAKNQRVPRFSLAALQSHHPILSKWQSDGGNGLRRFKKSFSPRMEPLYIAAPNRLLLALACLDITLRIHRPAPLQDGPTSSPLQGIQEKVATMAKDLRSSWIPVSPAPDQPVLSKMRQ